MEIDASLPAGTVTFLLTDIEGSTRLWEQHPQAMEVALARHDAVAESVIRQHEGMLVKHRGEGDSLFAVFALARHAVSAAIALQRGWRAELWPAGITLRVRVAIHTGSCEPRDGDYYGAAVNCCARLRDAAHGGQVLLSSATQELVRDDLPPEASLRDLGTHRLRDLRRAAHIFQLIHPTLPAGFPSLRNSTRLRRRWQRVILFTLLVLILIATILMCVYFLEAPGVGRSNPGRRVPIAFPMPFPLNQLHLVGYSMGSWSQAPSGCHSGRCPHFPGPAL